jgi:hypothetical protein
VLVEASGARTLGMLSGKRQSLVAHSSSFQELGQQGQRMSTYVRQRHLERLLKFCKSARLYIVLTAGVGKKEKRNCP